MNGGKFSEAAYTVLKGIVDGNFPLTVVKPPRFDQACRDFENASTSFPRSVRIGIPRVLIALYEVRNNRNVGHLGGDVDPNTMDAALVLGMVKWVMAEFVRIFHSVSADEAARAVEQITERDLPIIWSVGDVKRILRPGLPQKIQVLILLHQNKGSSTVKELAASIEVRADNLKRAVLLPLHKDRLIELETKTGLVNLSPSGVKRAEAEIKLAI